MQDFIGSHSESVADYVMRLLYGIVLNIIENVGNSVH